MEHAGVIAAALGVVSAVLGVITAIINRKRIIELRHTTTSPWTSAGRPPVTFGKRFKRLCISVGLAFLLMMAIGAIVGQGPPYDKTNETWAMILLVPFLILCLMAAYQCVAMVIVLFARLWQ
jgi:hypothetical protein